LSIKQLYQYSQGKRNLVILLLLVSAFSFSCKKDTTITSSSAKLSFSQTSVLFDTVFTTLGSTVQAFLVRNTHNQPITISSVYLAGNYTSPFKINIDGVPGTTFSNITVPANDSIFVFVTCTINPTNKNNPIVIEDSLMFTTNGNVQSVYLEAWGQDANFFKPNVFPPTGPAYCVIPCSSTWDSTKPYVIYGYALVNTGCTLTIKPGTKIYMHNNGVLWVNTGATLNVNGVAGHPVIFQGDRLEPAYQTVPGQWGEILLSPGSINNTITWAVIKNGTNGIECDTVGNSSPTLTIDHTIIKSMSNFGLLGQGTYITGNDLLIEDCQFYSLCLNIGGKYRFNQCTFTNYWSYAKRQTSLLYINNYYNDINNNVQSRDMDSATFYNCIIWGSSSEEVDLGQGGTGKFNYYFGNCDIETQRSIVAGVNYNNFCLQVDPGFLGTSEPPNDNYRVSNSSVMGQGTNIYGSYLLDLDNTTRKYPSTMGAYEN
jgi:hypothetical protein